MTSKTQHEDELAASAEKIYEEFARRRERGEAVSIEEYCERYPSRSVALRLLEELPGDSLSEALFVPSESLGSIGKYQLVRSLGRGGFGEVYLARQPSPQRDVALKVLKPGMDSREILARFERERQALAVLSHPNIATIFEAGETAEGRPYFVMEYVPGKPATHYCRETGLGLRDRLAMFLKICSALQHAHQHGILHRDIKPLNILVASRDSGVPEPKIIDFGLAKALEVDLAEESMATRDGCIMGTPLYIAPEQIDGSIPVDRRADVYALGVVLYELLTDDRPFQYSGPLRYDELRRLILDQDAPPPSRCAARAEASGVPSRRPPASSRELRGELDWITLKALEKDPSRRYSSASELASDLACYLNGEPIVAGPPSGIYRVKKLARRHRVKLAIAFAALLIVAYPLYSLVSESLRVRGIVTEANSSYDEYTEVAEQIRQLHARWLGEQSGTVSWVPSWERGLELAYWRELLELGERLQPRHVLAVQSLSQAKELDLVDDRDKFSRQFDEVLSAKGAPSELGVPVSAPSVASPGYGVFGDVALGSDPPGADIYCFRYEERGARWMPLPFDPEAGSEDPARGVGEIDFLQVDGLWPRADDEVLPPFLVGDRVLSVNGTRMRSLKDLAKVLTDVAVNVAVAVDLQRDDTIKRVVWTPLTSSRVDLLRRVLKHFKRPADAVDPGRLVEPFLQLGVTFASCPLVFREQNRVGRTETSRSLLLRVPAGSYLFVLKKPGFVDTRVPVATSTSGEIAEAVELIAQDRVPEGFVYVCAGRLATGGDPEADQSFEEGERDVDGFFMKKLELTGAEWLEFLNDPEVFDRIDPDTGTAEARHPEVVAELRALGMERVQLVPARNGEQYLRLSSEKERRFESKAPGLYNRAWPAQLVSHHAALEYVHWRNEKATRAGEPWLYRLPTDAEWERAARGVDRRHYVWGDYLIWSFCRSQQGTLFPQAQAPGIASYDESVFGIRDLNGSVREHTTGKPFGRFRTCRGGSYDQVSDVYFRLASRNGFLPQNWAWDHGVRLVAVLRENDALR